MKFNTTFYIFAVLLLFAACSGDKSEAKKGEYNFNNVSALANETEEVSSSDQQTATRQIPGKSKIQTEQKIIKNGFMTVESEDAAKSKKKLDATVEQLGGYFEKEDAENNHRVLSYNISIRVPAENFKKLVNSIETGGDKVSNKSITAKNVTEEFYDLQTRLENKKAYLLRFKELLNRANTIEEILQIEEKIRPLEEEIESTEGRIRFLNDQVGYSTLTLNLFQKQAYYDNPSEDTFSERVKRAFSTGWAAIGHFTIALLTMWPFLLLVAAGLFFYRRLRKRNKLKP